VFQDILREVVENTDGAVAGVIMGYDGITLDTFQPEEVLADIETVGMEFSVILSQIRQAAEMLEVGEAREVAVQAENMVTVVRMLNEQYFIAVTLRPGGNAGKARYQLRIRALSLTEQLV